MVPRVGVFFVNDYSFMTDYMRKFEFVAFRNL